MNLNLPIRSAIAAGAALPGCGDRRSFSSLAFAVAMLSLLLAAGPSSAQDAERGRPNLKREKVDDHLDRAVQYLIARQHPREGWIADNESNRTAMTSLAIMAMLSVGHQFTDKTPEGDALRKALAFVLRPENQDDNGYYGNRDGSRMYGHGITTLMLGEVAGMTLDEPYDKLVLQRLAKGVDLILRAQKVRKSGSFQGGWRYTPDSGDSDLSITVWQLMALRSAKNAGLEIPGEAIDQAVEYLKNSYGSRRNGRGDPTERMSGFSYTPGGQPIYSTTTAGMLAMQVCGLYDAPQVKGATEWLMTFHPKLHFGEQYFYYGTYYYAQAMHHRGGKFAEHARAEVERVLAPQQRKDGSWAGGEGGVTYSTTMAVLSLSVKYHYLPIYQR